MQVAQGALCRIQYHHGHSTERLNPFALTRCPDRRIYTGTGSDPSNTADGITSSTTATAAAAAATGDLERTPGWAEAAPTSPHRQQHRQAEAMPRCTPRARGRHTSQLEVLCEPIHRFLCGGSAESGGGDLNSTEGAGATGLTKRTRLRAGRGCGGGGKGVRMRGGVCGNGGRAHWREVRRFLEVRLERPETAVSREQGVRSTRC